LSASPSRIIVVQHNALSQQAKRPGLQFKALPFLYRRFLRRAAAIVAVSNGVARETETICRLDRGSVQVVYNGVVGERFAARAAAPVAHPWLDGRRGVLIAVGRMVAQKDHATLVRAFAQATKSRDLRLILLGEGPLRGELSSLAASLGVADRVDCRALSKTRWRSSPDPPHSFCRRGSRVSATCSPRRSPAACRLSAQTVRSGRRRFSPTDASGV
jgi:glycosyltransferase involved in cell wall biosynthesis